MKHALEKQLTIGLVATLLIPFLLLSGMEPVAEGLPAHLQPLVG